MRHGERWAAGALCGLVIAAMAGPAQAYEHRRDTASVGIQIQYGDLERNSDWGDAFGWGRGVAIHLRNSMARNRAIGLSFEQQRFESVEPLAEDVESGGDTDYLEMQTFLVDYFFYFERPQRRCYYAVVSAGFYRPELVDEERLQPDQPKTVNVRYPGENFLARLGGGTEYFVSRKFSVDASVSLYYIRAPKLDGLTASAQFALGVHLYAGR
jgi:hypothetical protein